MTDYIAREAALDAIDCGNLHRGVVDALRANLNEVPAAPVSRVRHARWAPVTSGRGGHECGHCREYAPSFQSGVENKSKYCPNCGAMMDGRGEE